MPWTNFSRCPDSSHIRIHVFSPSPSSRTVGRSNGIPSRTSNPCFSSSPAYSPMPGYTRDCSRANPTVGSGVQNHSSMLQCFPCRRTLQRSALRVSSGDGWPPPRVQLPSPNGGWHWRTQHRKSPRALIRARPPPRSESPGTPAGPGGSSPRIGPRR